MKIHITRSEKLDTYFSRHRVDREKFFQKLNTLKLPYGTFQEIIPKIQASVYSDRTLLFAYEKEELVGWAILSIKDRDKKRRTIQLFVDPIYRNKGIGASIVKKAKKLNKPYNLLSCPHDETSNHFFLNKLEKVVSPGGQHWI